MQCAIYKSLRKQDTYLYLAARDNFSCVPGTLLELIGQWVHVMDLDLSPERRLAREDTAEVLLFRVSQAEPTEARALRRPLADVLVVAD